MILESIALAWANQQETLRRKITKLVSKSSSEWYDNPVREYETFIPFVWNIIFPEKNISPNPEDGEIITFNVGSYNGTAVFIIRPEGSRYEEDVFIGYVYYGSCAGCDALQAAYKEPEIKEKVQAYMSVALTFLQSVQTLQTALYKND